VPPFFEDSITGEIFDLDINPNLAREYGYTLVSSKRGMSSVSDGEFFGAQDPAWLERERLAKQGDFFQHIKKKTRINPGLVG